MRKKHFILRQSFLPDSQIIVLVNGTTAMAQEFVKAQIKGNKVVVFQKPSCPYCVLAKDVLCKYTFKPGHLEFIDISGRDDMGSIQEYLQQITGARTVPRVFVGEECIGGGSDVAELDRNGQLDGMLRKIGALQ